MPNNKAFKAFKENIASFIETLKNEGFQMCIKEHTGKDQSKIDHYTKQYEDFLLNLSLYTEHPSKKLDLISWKRVIKDNLSVYVHLSFQKTSTISDPTFINDIQVLVTYNQNFIEQTMQKYIKIPMPNSQELLTSIQNTENKINEKMDKINSDMEMRKINAPIALDNVNTVFSGIADISVSKRNMFILVNYKGTEIKVPTLEIKDTILFNYLGVSKEITLEQIRDIIDIVER